MCGVFSSMCRWAATTLSLLNVALQPLDTVVAPFVEFAFFLYVHHVLVRTRQNHPNDTDLVVRDFPSDACRVQPVGNRFIPCRERHQGIRQAPCSDVFLSGLRF